MLFQKGFRAVRKRVYGSVARAVGSCLLWFPESSVCNLHVSEMEGPRGQRCVFPSLLHLQCLEQCHIRKGPGRTSVARFQKHWILNVCSVLNLCLA